MGISIDKLIHHSNNAIQPAKNSNRKAAAETPGKNFDKVMISSNATQIQEKKITEDLEARVLSQINKQPQGADIEALKQAVAQGTYQIRPEEIASRILLEGGH